ncbi:cell division protein FtsQ/DivIB [Enterococcus eurekensis]|uniref:Cell division protein DivIB n=1 Tax=Enterococcus eurekensis TaxID=1159753 RepID=A0ABV9M441_9ENTE
MASSKEESNDEELTEQEALENQEDASEVAESLVDREESAPKSENKLLSFSKKLPNLQAYRDKKLRKRLILLVSLFLIPLVGSLYYISPLSNLSAVQVKAQQKVTQETILETANFEIGERLWPQFFNREAVANKVTTENPWIKKTTITLQDWNKFAIQVKEYEEVAYLVKGNQYLPILENGKIIQEPIKKIDNRHVILESFSKEAQILATLKEYEKLPAEIQDSISQIKLTPSKKNDELITLFMNDGNQVFVNISDFSKQMKYYLQVAKEMKGKGVIDMEVGIYSYPYAEKDEETTESSQSEESF